MKNNIQVELRKYAGEVVHEWSGIYLGAIYSGSREYLDSWVKESFSGYDYDYALVRYDDDPIGEGICVFARI